MQEGAAAFLARVDEIAKEKLASDPKLQYMPEANVSREVMQELDRCVAISPPRCPADQVPAYCRRYPLVERAVQDVRLLKDPTFIVGMKESMRKILQEDRKASGQGANILKALRSTSYDSSRSKHERQCEEGCSGSKWQ